MRVSGAEPRLKSHWDRPCRWRKSLEEAWRAPSGESLSGLFPHPPLQRRRVADLCTESPTDSPTVLSSERKIPLDARRPGANVVSCFGSRKTNEAWNPGSFGCRGLLVYGVLKSRHPQKPGCARFQARTAKRNPAFAGLTAKAVRESRSPA